MAKNKLEYWFCYVGPADGSKLLMGADAPMREGVREAFCRVTGEYPVTLGSGWGVNPDQVQEISFAAWDESTKRAVVGSYAREGKTPPPHILAWKLYFDHVDKPKRKKRKFVPKMNGPGFSW